MLISAVVLTVGAYICDIFNLTSLFGTAMAAAILVVACGVLSESRHALQYSGNSTGLLLLHLVSARHLSILVLQVPLHLS